MEAERSGRMGVTLRRIVLTLFVFFFTLPQPLLSAFAPALRPIGALTLMNGAPDAAILLTRALYSEEVPALGVRACGEVARKNQLAPKNRIK